MKAILEGRTTPFHWHLPITEELQNFTLLVRIHNEIFATQQREHSTYFQILPMVKNKTIKSLRWQEIWDTKFSSQKFKIDFELLFRVNKLHCIIFL